MKRIIRVTAKTRIQLAEEYGIITRTLARWFKKYNFNFDPHMLMPIQVQLVYDTFGFPHWHLIPEGSKMLDQARELPLQAEVLL